MDAPTFMARRPSAIKIDRLPSFGLQSPLLPTSFDASISAPRSPLLETPPTTPPCGSYFNPLAAPQGFAGVYSRGYAGGAALSRRNSSLSVASSLGSDDGKEEEEDWSEADKERLKKVRIFIPLFPTQTRRVYDGWADATRFFRTPKQTIDQYLAASTTVGSPFAGAPPSNLTHVIARAVVNNNGPQRRTRSTSRVAPTAPGDASTSESERDEAARGQWRHGMKSTRAKIIALVRERETNVEDTPRAGDSDATPRRRGAAQKMVRQGSMDFLPATSRNVGIVARLGSKLHRAEAGPPPSHSGSHPYANASRGRLNRANSLSSIAGSPTQPPTSSSHSSNPSSSATSPTTARKLVHPSSSRMLRVASDHSAGHLSRTTPDYFSFHGKKLMPMTTVETLHPMMALDDREPTHTSTSSASQPGLLGLAFSETPSSLQSHQKFGHKKSNSGGLASAFHSPALKYPSPVSLRKKKSTSPLPTSSNKSAPRFGFDITSSPSSSSASSSSSSSDLDMELEPSLTPSTSFDSPSQLGEAIDSFPMLLPHSLPFATLTTPSGRTVSAINSPNKIMSPQKVARANFFLAGLRGEEEEEDGMNLCETMAMEQAEAWTPEGFFSREEEPAREEEEEEEAEMMGYESSSDSPMGSNWNLNKLSLVGKEEGAGGEGDAYGGRLE
ncbi:hypothetical protein P7C70_g8835, partial [Phenoliferia sp. Uapishka_3]